MKSETYALMLPVELLGKVRQTAQETGLSVADTICRSLELGLPKLRQELVAPRLAPFSPDEVREAFGPDPEWDAVAAVMSRLPISRIEE
jgi:hypothetical protein